MLNDIITVYNKYVDGGVEKWQRTVLQGVFWNAIRGAVVRRTGVAPADNVQIIIPFTLAKVPLRIYQAPKVWTALANKTDTWTLQPGDTVIKGDIDYEIVKSTKELQGYDDVLLITSVDTKSFGGSMAHWEVSGK